MVLSKTQEDPKSITSIYKAVVQAVLLYGCESWVPMPQMEQSLQSFHHKCARYITGQHIRKNADGTWTCPKSSKVLEKANLLPIQAYIEKQRNTITS
jgi:hypothetical protein